MKIEVSLKGCHPHITSFLIDIPSAQGRNLCLFPVRAGFSGSGAIEVWNVIVVGPCASSTVKHPFISADRSTHDLKF